MDTSRIYTVSEITGDIKANLENTFGVVCIDGEASNVSTPGSGHVYFTLKDEASELSCVMWR